MPVGVLPAVAIVGGASGESAPNAPPENCETAPAPWSTTYTNALAVLALASVPNTTAPKASHRSASVRLPPIVVPRRPSAMNLLPPHMGARRERRLLIACTGKMYQTIVRSGEMTVC
jgi:hypothetical protein